jgi:hypothetical protein
MLWAMPTVNGLKNAAANPAAAPRNGMATPTIESYPRRRASGMKMMTNGMTSSDIPKTDPPREKITISDGMSSPSRCGRLVMVSVSLRMPNSTAPVSWKMAKLPPIISRKQMSSAPSRKPLIGDSSTIWGPSSTFGTSR